MGNIPEVCGAGRGFNRASRIIPKGVGQFQCDFT